MKMDVYAHIHTYLLTYIHTYTHIYMYIQTYISNCMHISLCSRVPRICAYNKTYHANRTAGTLAHMTSGLGLPVACVLKEHRMEFIL